jgi:Calcineurin-like phosphoesterase
MKTLIVSDLHFGSATRTDVLRMPEAQQALLGALQGIDRLVLLGDVLELRHGPPREALRVARPFFEELGAVMDGREIVLLAGNHDHALVEGWLQRRAEQEDPAPLGLEQRLTPEEASSMAAQLAEWAAPARMEIAHPGLWVRDDVYAMHGHYLDAHLTVPTMERLFVGLVGKLLRRPQQSLRSVDDYEAVTAPIYALICAVAAQGATRSALSGSATVRIWRLLHGGSARRRKAGAAARTQAGREIAAKEMRRGLLSSGLGHGLRAGALRRGFPLVVAALDRAGLGPLRSDISGPELRRACLKAIGEVAARLGIGDAYLVFGHTHRLGPLPGDCPSEWTGRLGARLINTGSWTYNRGFLSPGETDNPYWPGSCVLVQDGESAPPPDVIQMLSEAPLAALEELSLSPASGDGRA